MSQNPQQSWSKEEAEKLKDFWMNTTLTATQISKAFDYKYSRNAILGKVNRLKLPLRVKPKAKVKPRKRRPKTSGPTKGAIVAVFGPMMSGVPKDPRPVREASWKPLPGIEPVSLMERTGCCWIVTQDSPFLYCNHSVDEGSKLSYCSHHLDMYVSKERPARIRIRE